MAAIELAWALSARRAARAGSPRTRRGRSLYSSATAALLAPRAGRDPLRRAGGGQPPRAPRAVAAARSSGGGCARRALLVPWSEGGLAEAPSPARRRGRRAGAGRAERRRPASATSPRSPTAPTRRRRASTACWPRGPPRAARARSSSSRASTSGAAARAAEARRPRAGAARPLAGVRFAGTLAARRVPRAAAPRARVRHRPAARGLRDRAARGARRRLRARHDALARPVRRAAARPRARPAAGHRPTSRPRSAPRSTTPPPGYAERAAEALRPWRPEEVDRVVADAAPAPSAELRPHACSPPVRELGDAARRLRRAATGLTYAELRAGGRRARGRVRRRASASRCGRSPRWRRSSPRSRCSSPAPRSCPSTRSSAARELEHVLTDSAPDAIVGGPDELPVEPRRLTVDTPPAAATLPEPRRRRRGPRAGRLHVRHHRPPQGRRAPAPRGRLQPRRARRRLGVDRRGRAHPRAAAVPRPRARDRRVRPAAPRRRAAPPRPLRARRGRRRAARAARRCCSASRRCTTGSPARPRSDAAIADGPARRAPARLRLGAAPRPRLHADRGAHAASRSSSATGSRRR